jgi:hypothetical protein
MNALYVANVTGTLNNDGSPRISALDASFILRKAVDPDFLFPVEAPSGPAKEISSAAGTLNWLVTENSVNSDNFQVGIRLADNARDVYSISIDVEYDANSLTFASVNTRLPEGWMAEYNDKGNGTVTIAMAGVTPLTNVNDLATVTFTNNAGEMPSFVRGVAFFNEDAAQELGELELRQIPDEFALGQNFPNPFNPSTTIRYQLPEQSNVTISIYNVVGQRVAVLVNNEVLEAGIHEVQFNASNLASGTYLYRIQANNFISTRKMLLIK